MLRLIRLCSPALLAVVLLTFPAHSRAGPEQFTTVVVPRQTLDSRFSVGGTIAETLGSITATVDSRLCATASLVGPSNTNSAGDKILVLGTDDQPAVCRTPGGRIVLYDGRGLEFFLKLTVQPGETIRLANLAPMPPSDPDPSPSGFGFVTGGFDAPGAPPDFAPFIMFLPHELEQPVSVAEAIRYATPIEGGRYSRVLPVGRYMVLLSAVDVGLFGSIGRLQIEGNAVHEVDAVPLVIVGGATASLNLQAIHPPGQVPAPQFAAPFGPIVTSAIEGFFIEQGGGRVVTLVDVRRLGPAPYPGALSGGSVISKETKPAGSKFLLSCLTPGEYELTIWWSPGFRGKPQAEREVGRLEISYPGQQVGFELALNPNNSRVIPYPVRSGEGPSPVRGALCLDAGVAASAPQTVRPPDTGDGGLALP